MSAATVTIGGVSAVVSYAGLVGTGLYQLNVAVPSLANGTYPVVATINACLVAERSDVEDCGVRGKSQECKAVRPARPTATSGSGGLRAAYCLLLSTPTSSSTEAALLLSFACSSPVSFTW